MKKFKTIMIVLLSIWIINIHFAYNFINNKGSPIENSVLRKEINNNTNFALMLEQNDGTYIESTNSKWPDNYSLNLDKSKCIDKNGNELDKNLKYINNVIKITTNTTSYCYLYFDKVKDFLSKKLIYFDTISDIGLQQDFVAGDDLYRFAGTNGNTGINNYICLGTNSCTSGSDNMYRIIGVNPDNGEVKIIKETSWNNGATYIWNTSYVGPTWLTSELYTNTVSKIYDNLTFKNLIVENHKWNVGQAENLSISTRTSVIDYENNTTGTATMGILSLSDYYLAYNGDRNWYKDYDLNNWLNNYSNPAHEWTMTYYGIYGTAARPWLVSNSYGGTNIQGTINTYTIRPTFYLKPEVKYVSGTGTINDPFIVLYESTAVDTIISNAGDDLWKSTLEEDGHRYVGTNPSNYICFGTTDKSTCIGNTDKYMYRIIGIFEDEEGKQHLKLIKKEALNTSYAWNEDSSNDVNWENSDLYKGLNGDYFLNNTTYSYMQNSNWLNKIETWNYTSTNTKTYESLGMNYYSSVIRQTYLHEMNRSSKTSSVGVWETVSGKISLMYVSDYQLSLGATVLDYTNNNSTHYRSMKTGWMHISNNDSGAPSQQEWISARYGFYDFYYNAWAVYGGGYVHHYEVDGEYSIRPVFHLTSEVTISGEGTIENPYIITN